MPNSSGFEAYLDESETGREQTKVFTLSCLIAPAACWRRFERLWEAALARAGAGDKIIHMREVAHGVGQFAGWDNSNQTALFRRLVPIIRAHVSFGFAGSFALNDYKRLMNLPQGAAGEEVTPYALALQGTLEAIVERVKVSEEHPVRLFMEQNAAAEVDAERHFFHLTQMRRWSRIFPSIVPLEKGPAPLQAADIVAYEWSRYSSEHILGNSERPPRRLFLEIGRSRKFIFSNADPRVMNQLSRDLIEAHETVTHDPQAAEEMHQSFEVAHRRMQKRRSARGRTQQKKP